MSVSSVEQDDCVPALERIARRNPDRAAVIDAGRVTSYGQLQAAITQRAGALQAAGLERRDRVALIAESSALYLATALAVWRAGGVLVTIYPSSGADELRYAAESDLAGRHLIAALPGDAWRRLAVGAGAPLPPATVQRW